MKQKKLFCLSLAAVMAVSVAALAACGKEGPKDPSDPAGSLVPTAAYQMPTASDAENLTTNVAVHDPSVFYDENSKTYYAFGSHYAVASSKDLVKWKQEVPDKGWSQLYDATNPVNYAGKQWPKALDATLKIVQPASNGDKTIDTTWAPDVNYYNGKYYMYYSITKRFGSNQSAIGRVSSTNVLGPYDDNEIIIESATSTESNHPNAIDPELFTDKDGRLWMVYGSHFAGVYIKELNNSGANWGLPKEDGWGTLLWKGGGKVVEGPFVFYNPLTEYYYLMTTYADLNTDYNMRIARSENPDGPYVDVTGADMATTSNNGTLHGNKVAGSYKFAEAGTQQAYAAMGHNSVVQDPKTGNWFVVYHSRRQTGTTVYALHHLRVSQLFFNEDGWPVMSPVSYVGEKFGLITQEQAAGDYDIIVHTTGSSVTIAESEKYTLSADGKVTKGTAEAGTWSITDSFYVTITLNGTEYKGVIVPGWDMYTPNARNQKPVFAITAISKLSDQGGSLWAISPRA